MSSKYRGGVNSDTYNILFDESMLPMEDNSPSEVIFHTIDVNNLETLFSKAKLSIIYKLVYGNSLENNKIKFNKEKKCYEYDLGDNGKIKFKKLSKCISGLDKEHKKELLTVGRHGKCHVGSLFVSLSVKNSKLLSGICKLDTKTFYHSVVLFDNEMVADWTKNLVMRKDEYLKITNFESISTIDSVNLDELIMIDKFFPKLDLRMYLYFRDEIVHDLDKHGLLRK